jgi:hypothetical protein
MVSIMKLRNSYAEIGCEGVDYIQLAEDRVQWRGFLRIGCEGVDYIQVAEDRVQWRGFL